jgi:DNA-binding CsgD family transcriptional regulator
LNKFLSILLIFVCSVAYSQGTYFDKLKAELETKDNAKAYLYELLTVEKKNSRLAVISNALGLQFQRENDLDSAFYCHNKALEYALKVSDNNQEIGISYNKIGVVYYYKGELDNAIVYFKKSIPFYKDKSLKANSLSNLASVNKYNSNPDLAIKNYLLAYDVYKEIKDTVKQIFLLSNISGLYSDLKSFDKAREYVDRGILLAQTSQNEDGEMNCKSNLGKILTESDHFGEAIPLFNECIAYYTRTKEYRFLIIAKNNLANCYDGLGEKEVALKIYLEVLGLIEKTGIENNKESILVNVGSSYQELGDYNKALSYTHRALIFSKLNGLVLRYEPIYKSLSSIFQSMNNMDSSLHYKNLQIVLRDSLDNVEREKKMMELESKHQNKELNSDLRFKQSELDETEKQRDLISESLVYSLVIILITVFGVFVFYNRYQNKKRLSEELEGRNQMNQSEIESLESTLETQNEEIENLSHLSEKGKLPYPKNLAVLTEREQEVLIGVQEGLKDKEIADKLFISITTVRTHLRKAYAKIDVRNRAEAIQFISKFEI